MRFTGYPDRRQVWCKRPCDFRRLNLQRQRMTDIILYDVLAQFGEAYRVRIGSTQGRALYSDQPPVCLDGDQKAPGLCRAQFSAGLCPMLCIDRT